MKDILIRVLRAIAVRQIARFQPKIIAVTGSVGKTMTKTAIAIALGAAHSVRTGKKNYNNEIGVPLAILGESSPGRRPWGWLMLCWRQIRAVSFPSHLVLEYGADKAGDIAASCAIAPPSIAVITSISPVHVSNYENFGALVEEKASIGDGVSQDGLVILNADDQTVALLRDRFAAPVATYGDSGKQARILSMKTMIYFMNGPSEGDVFVTTSATIDIEGETASLTLKNSIGHAPVTACAAALLVARRYDVRLRKASLALSEQFAPEPGRMHPIAGVKGSLILDDTYNAAPASVMAALDTVDLFRAQAPNARRIVALGKMAELGQYTEAEHAAVGRRVAEVADVFLAVGEEMHGAAQEAQRAGMKRDAIVTMASATEAGRWLDANVRAGDVILVKGSQSARMEKAVKDILAEPLKAASVLCRQDEVWLSRE